jgi:hypothetical protein
VEELFIQPRSERHSAETGCAYILGENGERRNCGAPRHLGSPYCTEHHALCHVPSGTTEEVTRLQEVEALANAVGGRRARHSGAPSGRFLRRLEHAVRGFSAPSRS